jgi:mannose-1-phosphate guanylyltransferase
MVLAAGRGLRMRPLTNLVAKPALPVLNRPLLAYTLEHLARSGVREAIVNVFHLGATVVEALQAESGLGLKVTYSREARLLGTGGGPRRVVDALGDEPFLLVNGDVVCDFDLRALVRAHVRGGARATLALLPNPDPRSYSRVVTDPAGRIRSLAGLPRASRGRTSLFTGVHVLDPSLLQALAPGPSDIVRDLYVPYIEAGGRLMGVRVKGHWWDFGSPRAYLASQRAMLGLPRFRGRGIDPSARIHPKASVVRSVVGPGCRVGEGASIVESVLWAGTVVGAGASVRGSVVAGATLAPGARLRDALRLPTRRREVAL